eukprot:382865-Prymnesium_polylepis.1
MCSPLFTQSRQPSVRCLNPRRHPQRRPHPSLPIRPLPRRRGAMVAPRRGRRPPPPRRRHPSTAAQSHNRTCRAQRRHSSSS